MHLANWTGCCLAHSNRLLCLHLAPKQHSQSLCHPARSDPNSPSTTSTLTTRDSSLHSALYLFLVVLLRIWDMESAAAASNLSFDDKHHPSLLPLWQWHHQPLWAPPISPRSPDDLHRGRHTDRQPRNPSKLAVNLVLRPVRATTP
jgi:hypothetical protein